MGSLSRISSTIKRFFRILFRSNSRKVELIYDPIVLLITWGFFFITFRESPIAAVFFSSSILWHLSYSFQSTFNLMTLEDVWNDCFKEAIIIPLTFFEYLVSKAIASLIRNLIKVVAMITLATFFFGYSVFLENPFQYSLILAELFLLATAVALAIDSIILVAGREAQTLAWSANSLIILFACPYYPLEILPGFLQPIAKFSPYFAPFQQMKGLVLGSGPGFSFLNLVPIAVYLGISAILFSLAISKSRNDGTLARF